MVFKKYRGVIFINGCFWHGHKDCPLAYKPKTRVEFWTSKIEGTRQRDRRNIQDLEEQGWRVLSVWECSIKSKALIELPIVIDLIRHCQ